MSNSITIPALQKLVNVMGRERADAVIAETLRQLSLRELRTADDCLRFGDALIHRGGLLGAIGRAIKIQAILNGAIEHRATG
jgi:hypothetical protein